ncbi:hypothetical protein Cgig2_014159 [Carnegiea gigantea]|uniref:Uncharacterized protein n=1 Tax=Carnegiea gigantea TaxID=171969 RepID=A0A9Q1JFW1_9CARY|nr:hypothetical protein Cgig2_003102 [Carnegiea gigantea]KAJ8429879.1 hypothetical protein Cgig2_014159 [Carnegiea gigantea]
MTTGELKAFIGPYMKFDSEDMYPLQTHDNDALVIHLKIATAIVRRILVNTRSSTDIITPECLKKLQYTENNVEAVETPVVGVLGARHKNPHKRDISTEQDGKEGGHRNMVVLSTSAEVHERPYLEPTSEVMPIPSDPSCSDWTVQVGKDLNLIIKDGIA